MMIKKTIFSIIIVCALLSGCATSGGIHDGTFSMIIDNDVFTGSDNNYTNGLGLTWTTNDVRIYENDSFILSLANTASALPGIDAKNHPTYFSWTIGQEMNTPNDISIVEPSLDDQPYSGILYLDNIVQSRIGRWNHIWGLRLGMVGPSARGGEVQREFHELMGIDEPRGWDTQLPDEAIINVSYTAGYLLRQSDVGTATWRIIPIAGVSAGNYATTASVGMYAEFGWNLADALAANALRNGLNTSMTAGAEPQSQPSFSMFLGVSAYGVAHYLPLDGTLFRDSRSADSNSTVGTISSGLALRYKRLAMSWSLSYFGETFATQRENTEFGSFSFAYFY